MYSTGVCYVLFRCDMAWGGTVLVCGCSGAQCSVEQQFKQRVSSV